MTSAAEERLRARAEKAASRVMNDDVPLGEAMREAFPECLTGDVGPDAVFALDAALSKFIRGWARNNAPGQLSDGHLRGAARIAGGFYQDAVQWVSVRPATGDDPIEWNDPGIAYPVAVLVVLHGDFPGEADKVDTHIIGNDGARLVSFFDGEQEEGMEVPARTGPRYFCPRKSCGWEPGQSPAAYLSHAGAPYCPRCGCRTVERPGD